MDDRFDLSGKVALVTGGSRGLGREMVLAFAEHGADVVIASRKLEACEELAHEVTEQTGRRAVASAFHAGKWEQADQLAELVYAEFGRCDVLVNNAGMSPLYPSLPEVSEELFDKVVGVNFKGPFRLASLIGTQMAEGAGGSIINVSSIAAVAPTPHELVYAGAKAALDAMTSGMARAFAPKVRCNVIMPGPFLTDISKAWDLDAFNARAKTEIPLQRGGEAHEIVGAALYLASDA
ncbi:MAG: SDR family NAD(P)-dependent oxidoreductase, partial [Actinomycetota bacterium]|nr:SDR family NAD(P)-dependent oxidoreductase [Actinomycetota bacterium]